MADEEVAALVERLLQRFQTLDGLHAGPARSDGALLLVGHAGKLSQRQQLDLAAAIVAEAARDGFTALPMIYDAADWRALGAAAETERFLALFDEQSGRATLLELYRSRTQHRRLSRELVQRAARDAAYSVDFLSRASPFPLHMTLDFAARACADALSLLFASRGMVFGADAATLRAFDSELAPSGFFEPTGLASYFQLVALAEQAQKGLWLTLDDDESRVAWRDLLGRAHVLMRGVERYLGAAFTTAVERKRLRRNRLLLVAAIVLGVAGVGGGYVIATWPISPIENGKLITRRGFVRAEYFAGINFNKKVAERDERSINFSTSSGPVPEVGRDRWSARYSGYLYFPKNGATTLCVESDDGSRVWIKGRKVLDNWGVHPKKRECTTVRVKRGWFPLRVDYFEENRTASLQLLRGKSKKRATLVPSTHLCCGRPSKRTPNKRTPNKRRGRATGLKLQPTPKQPTVIKPVLGTAARTKAVRHTPSKIKQGPNGRTRGRVLSPKLREAPAKRPPNK